MLWEGETTLAFSVAFVTIWHMLCVCLHIVGHHLLDVRATRTGTVSSGALPWSSTENRAGAGHVAGTQWPCTVSGPQAARVSWPQHQLAGGAGQALPLLEAL